MPGRQTVRYHGLELRASPDFWLRRWSRFPFYFESHNPSFRIDVRRIGDVGEDHFPNRSLIFRIVFSDGTETEPLSSPLPVLELDQSERIVLPEIFTAAPGQTRIVMAQADALWHTLYSYLVMTEDRMWLPFVTLLGVVASSALTLLVQRIVV